MATIRVEFDGGEWADLFDPGDLSFRAVEKLAGQLDHLRTTADSAGAEEFIRERIAAWHLIDADSGAEMNDPRTDDLKGLTGKKVKAIMSAFSASVSDFFPSRPKSN